MKNLESMLSSQGVVLLNHKELSTLKGGGTYTCYCGHVGGEYEEIKHQIEADSLEEALTKENFDCGMTGSTCTGN